MQMSLEPLNSSLYILLILQITNQIVYSSGKYHLNLLIPSESLSHNNRSLVRKLCRHTLLGIKLRIVKISIRDFRNKFLCTTARSKQYEDGIATTEQIYKQLMPHQTSCLRKFLTYPTSPSKLPTLKPKSSGRVLTSADSIRDLEEKKRKKEEKAIKKEENAKKREERSRKKKAEQIEREERVRKKKAEQSKRKQSSKSPALGKVCLYHLGSQHNMYCQSIQLLLLTTRA